MFLNDVHKKEEIKNLALQDLKALSIKFRPKKIKTQNVQDFKTRKSFKMPLASLATQTVTLPSGQQLVVPKLVHEMCSFILDKVETEGIFRKGGSRSRQNEIRLSLDAGCILSDDYHEVDVASVLKTFFRELPEPLFPYTFHDLFLRCIILPSKKLDAVLLSCLLLPCEHLNTLAYFMQFLYRVTERSAFNKMDAYNLAVVIGPTLFPIEEKLAPHATHRLTKTCELFKLLVENASAIGVVPGSIIERIALLSSSTSSVDEESLTIKRKKKRRSGSLTRMFNGLKKIVSNKVTEEVPPVTPDLLLTPCTSKSAKKRRFDNGGFSIKKKKEILNKLPEKAALSTPYTPISSNPNPKKKTPDSYSKVISTKVDVIKGKERKHHWSLRSKSSKSSKSDETSSVVARTSSGPKSLLERRWSQVSSQVTTFRKNKKRNSCAPSLTQESNSKTDDDQSDNGINEDIKSENISVESAEKKDSEYVKISKAEYEEIKYRVTEIERRISLELENPDGKLLIVKQLNTVENVQDAYEQTLEQAEPLSPTTDHLARRLSRELKIRRSAEQKIIRSPSARKIGTIRRRSRDQEKQNVKTNQYRCVSESDADSRAGTEDENREVGSKNQYENIESLSKSTARSSSFHGESRINQKTQVRRHSNCPSESENWRNGQVFFRNSQTPLNSAENGRSSLAKLRTQNAGMVLAKAKIFNELLDSVNTRKDTPTYYPRVRLSKTGTLRYNDRCSYRVRMLKADDKKPLKKSVMSPRRKTSKSPNAIRSSRLQVVKNGYSVPKDDDFSENKENKNTNTNLRHKTVIDTTTPSPVCVTPKSIPHIKRPLSVKASKKLTRTPLSTDSRLTPFKVMASARQNY